MISDNLKKAVSDGDLLRVRAIILRQINSDRDQTSFDMIDSCKYAEPLLAKQAQYLYDEDDGKSEFTEAKESWNKELWQSLRIEFEYNFSKKKFDHIISLMHYLRETGHPDFQICAAQYASSINTGSESTLLSQSKKPSPLQEFSAIASSTNQSEEHVTPVNKIEIEKYLTTGVVGAIVGGVVGSLVRMVIPGVIAGLLIGAAIAHAKNKSKDS